MALCPPLQLSPSQVFVVLSGASLGSDQRADANMVRLRVEQLSAVASVGLTGDVTVVMLASVLENSGLAAGIAESLRVANGRGCTLRHLWLDDYEMAGYREGFASQGPRPDTQRVQPKSFRSDDFHRFCSVNRRCADAICAETRVASPFVLIVDPCLSLVPQMVRARVRASFIAALWPLAWPEWQAFETSPWGLSIAEGLLGVDVLGLRTQADRRNFLTTVECCFEVTRDDGEQLVSQDGRRVLLSLVRNCLDCSLASSPSGVVGGVSSNQD
jgi:trehalose-6-phosphate synthase